MNQTAPNTNLAERLSSVRVGVRPELEVSRHLFQGVPAYIIRDPITFQSHQLSKEDYQIFISINADEPLSTTFTHLEEHGHVNADQSEDFYRFVLSLSQMGVLSMPITNGQSLYAKYKRKHTKSWLDRLWGVLFYRLPLVQPDAFLDRTVHWVSPLFSIWGFAIWLIAMVCCAALVISRWHAFTSPLGTLLTTQNLPLLWLLLVGLKTLHEFGHAYACKHFGGRVPEMGAFFVIFTPCAYVDASASWGFPKPLHRIIVALGGMYFESIAAVAATVIWAMTSSGTIHSAAHYTVVLATVVTVGFNLNPLMKYDGYYVLSDLLGMPNLRQESQKQIQRLVGKNLFGVTSETDSIPLSRAMILTTFGILSALYKVVLVLGIAIAIAFKIPAFGLTIAVAYVLNSLKLLVTSFARQLAALDGQRARIRAIAATATVASLGGFVLLAFPVPMSANAVGVLGKTHEHVVHAGVSGFLASRGCREGDAVSEHTPIFQLENCQLKTAFETKQAEITELRIEIQSNLTEQPAAAAVAVQHLESLLQEVAELREQVKLLHVRSPADGEVTEAESLDQTGRFVQRGEAMATISQGPWVVRSLATAETVAAAKPSIGVTVGLRFPADPSRAYQGRIIHIAPAGSAQIPNTTLTHHAGGEIAVSDTMEAKQPYFEVVVRLDDTPEPKLKHGMTAWLSFDATRASIGRHLWQRALHVLNQLRIQG